MGLGRFVREHSLYIKSCMGATGAIMPPRWAFFRQLADHLPAGADAIAEFGPGSGRLMEVALAQRKLLEKDGVYIAVDCNPDFLHFIYSDRAELGRDHEIYLLHEWAQTSRRKLEAVLQGRKLQAVVMSIPFSYLKPEESEEVWDTVRACSVPDVRVILYCVRTTRQMMLERCNHVLTYKDYGAHYGLPPPLEVNVGTGLVLPEEKKIVQAHLNGKAGSNGKLLHPPGPLSLTDRSRWSPP